MLGAGLLVGTALAVIIPEGVHALYEQTNDHGHSHGKCYPGPRGFLSPRREYQVTDKEAARKTSGYP